MSRIQLYFTAFLLVTLSFSIAPVQLNAQAETASFIIHRGHDNPIGKIEAYKYDTGDGFRYGMNSKSEFGFLMLSYILNLEIIADFDHSMNLLACSNLQHLNDNVRCDSKTHWGQDTYQINENGNERTLNKPINHTIARLYLEEPLGLTETYSEQSAVFIPMDLTAPHAYTLTLPNGRKTTFHYEKNELKLVEMHTLWADIYIKRVEMVAGK